MNSLLAVKLCLTPALIIGVSLVQRRWGAYAAGVLVGLPLTSGPLAAVFVLERGRAFASHAAGATLAGVISEVAFCFAYATFARRADRLLICLGAALIAFVVLTGVLLELEAPISIVYVVVLGAIWLAHHRLPDTPALVLAPAAKWDIPGRAAAATLFVVLLSGIAGHLGARLSGLISPFPIYAAVLIVFTHLQAGSDSALSALRGVLLGLYAFATFFVILSEALNRLPIPETFVLASLISLTTQTVVLRQRRSRAAGA